MLQLFVLHLAASMPACFQYQEWSIEPTPWTDEIYESMLRVVGGEVAVPQAPGWGVEILPSFLSQAQHLMSRADASPSARPCGAC